jgi:hypothetical protein
MNNGIKNKLKELIGKEVSLLMGGESGVISIHYPNPNNYSNTYTVLKIDGDDCVVLGTEKVEMFLSIDHISYITIMKT